MRKLASTSLIDQTNLYRTCKSSFQQTVHLVILERQHVLCSNEGIEFDKGAIQN